MKFFGEWADEIKSDKELPRFTDELRNAFESRHQIKIPNSLAELLRSKNGGVVENSDFRFHGEDYCVTEIFGIGTNAASSPIKSLAEILDNPGTEDLKLTLQRQQINPARILSFGDAGGYPWFYALNYNQRYSESEPTIVCIRFDGDSIEVKKLANTFTEFIEGQYFGDQEPEVKFDDAENLGLSTLQTIALEYAD